MGCSLQPRADLSSGGRLVVGLALLLLWLALAVGPAAEPLAAKPPAPPPPPSLVPVRLLLFPVAVLLVVDMTYFCRM